MAGKKAMHLFIGGPWDGRWLDVDSDAPAIRVPVQESSGSMVDAAPISRPMLDAMYRRASLRSPGREWVVFAAEDVADGDVIGRLIYGYSAASKS